MPEYVYALHDFLREYKDEVSFHVGELIEIIEKDDTYGDGWWRGRNPAGSVGLFPVSYTAPAPSAMDFSHTLHSPGPLSESYYISFSNSKFALQPLTEESETEASGINILSPGPKHPTTSLNNDYDTELPLGEESFHNFAGSGDEMMKATMTDVQKAIEQLGRDDVGEDGDGSRYSFASTRDGENTENSDPDFDLSDFDGTGINGNDGEDWRKGAMKKAVAKAKRAVEEAEKLESIMGVNRNGWRTMAPPIEVDFTDESEMEDDADDLTRSSNLQRNYPYTQEENGNVGTDDETSEAADGTRYSLSTDIFVPLNDETDIPASSKPPFSTPQTSAPTEPLPEEPENPPTIEKDIYPNPPDLTSLCNFPSHPHIPEEDENVGTDGATSDTKGTQYSASTDVCVPPKNETDIPTATKPSFSASQLSIPTLPEEPEEKPPTSSTIEKDLHPSPGSLPTTTLPNIQQLRNRSSTPVREISNGLPSPASVEHVISEPNRIISSSFTPGTLVNALQQQPNSTSVFTGPATISVSTTVQGRNETPLIEWSVEDVVDWLKIKGFDQSVCDKFIEQEISGDVLLELDVNLLKSEIGITAFGKRMRIANAITDLRRPFSIEYSDHQLSPSQLHHFNSLTTKNQSLSLPGTTPASTVGHVHWNSFGCPGPGYDGQQSGHLQESPVSIDVEKAAGPSGPVGMESGTASSVASGMSASTAVGLGVTLSPMNKPSEKRPPPRLLLSSSILKESATKTVSAIAVNSKEEEERGHMSDDEIVLNSTRKRPRTFGLSRESAVSTMNSSSHSKSFPLLSPIVLDEDNDNVKGKETSHKDTPIIGIQRSSSKRSVDSKLADRLTIFGSTFGGTSGKRRKPPPSEDGLAEKTSKFSFPRFHGSSVHRSLSMNSLLSTSNGFPQKSPLNLNSNVTTGINADAPVSVNRVSGLFSRGVNIMDRIGEPDHTGWMRKKGNGYNSWLRRYFILKGPHLYFLKSNNKSETRIKGYILILGYKVRPDENIDPGRYGFRIDHDHDQTHYFSSEERIVIRDWMKAIMKATILRDHSKAVISSCYIPTMPLVVAQAMDPAPRPPSPSTRQAIQQSLRRENTEQLSKRDTLILGLNVTDVKDRQAQLNSIFSDTTIVEGESKTSSPKASAPPQPSRQLGRMNSMSQTEDSLIKWANAHLPESLQIGDSTDSLSTGFGLGLLRLAESIKGQPTSPPVPNFAFPADMHDDNLDGLFRLFDFLLDNEVKMGSVSINDVRLGRRDKIIQLLKALKAWEDKLKAHALSITLKATSPAAFMLM